MDSMESFRQLFEYDHWANGEVMTSLASIPEQVEKPLRLFAHVLAAQRLWLARFANPNPPNAKPWASLTLEECHDAISNLHEHWLALLDRLTTERLVQDLTYRTTQGIEFKTPIRDVLTHLLMHSAYHRGQVAAAVRKAGGKPAATDYVAYLRGKK